MNKKEAILIAAQETFGQQGYAGTTMKDVATRAQVSFGLVSHYFGNKEDLFLAAGFDMANHLISTLRESIDATATGIQALQQYMSVYFNFTIRHRNTFPILLRCSPFSHIETGVDPSRVAERFREIIDIIKEIVELGINDGSIRDLPSEETALIIYGNIVGAVRTKLLTPYSTDNIYDETVRHVMRSLGTIPQDSE